MVLFRKKSSPEDSTKGVGETFRKFLKSDSDLVRIVGPEDGGCVCGDWVGAVVSVSGDNNAWPPLTEAVDDGVFHPDCRHRLETFNAERDGAEAQFCTELALVARARRQAGTESEVDESVSALFAKDPTPKQMDFERLYSAAREAEAAGAVDTALAKCEAALELLSQSNMYGDQQLTVEQALEARIRSILLKRP